MLIRDIIFEEKLAFTPISKRHLSQPNSLEDPDIAPSLSRPEVKHAKYSDQQAGKYVSQLMKKQRNIDPKDLKVPTTSDELSREFSKFKSNSYGQQGFFGRAMASNRPKNVGTVVKVPNIRNNGMLMADSAYRKFVDAIIHYNLADKTPYVPQIYQVRDLSGNEGKSVYQMERLQPLADNQLSIDAISSMCGRMFYDWDHEPSYEISYLGRSHMVTPHEYFQYLESIGTHERDIKSDLAGAISGRIDAKRGEYFNTKNIKDPLLLNTILFLAKRGLINDLHSGNLMLRVTSTGPQLVITDPAYALDY
jgi:hypothetical protein